MKALLEIFYYDKETREHCVEFEEIKLLEDGEPSMIRLRDISGQEDRRAIVHICDNIEEKYQELKKARS